MSGWPKWWDRELAWFERGGERGRWRWFVSASRSNLNLPRVWADWVDHDVVMLAFDWGNGNSDPVFSASIEVRHPGRPLTALADWLMRLAERR